MLNSKLKRKNCARFKSKCKETQNARNTFFHHFPSTRQANVKGNAKNQKCSSQRLSSSSSSSSSMPSLSSMSSLSSMPSLSAMPSSSAMPSLSSMPSLTSYSLSPSTKIFQRSIQCLVLAIVVVPLQHHIKLVYNSYLIHIHIYMYIITKKAFQTKILATRGFIGLYKARYEAKNIRKKNQRRVKQKDFF